MSKPLCLLCCIWVINQTLHLFIGAYIKPLSKTEKNLFGFKPSELGFFLQTICLRILYYHPCDIPPRGCCQHLSFYSNPFLTDVTIAFTTSPKSPLYTVSGKSICDTRTRGKGFWKKLKLGMKKRSPTMFGTSRPFRPSLAPGELNTEVYATKNVT